MFFPLQDSDLTVEERIHSKQSSVLLYSIYKNGISLAVTVVVIVAILLVVVY